MEGDAKPQRADERPTTLGGRVLYAVAMTGCGLMLAGRDELAETARMDRVPLRPA
ncbi:MAG: hypothetical protein M3319_01160 [Actinomycetota bacterium]|nr:hypothetical protein [Actinomycetota bacterium]MDQ3899109.1 hypothetical protein [Actinomycetota bacterium]